MSLNERRAVASSGDTAADKKLPSTRFAYTPRVGRVIDGGMCAAPGIIRGRVTVVSAPVPRRNSETPCRAMHL